MPLPLPPDIAVLCRGWLHGNVVIIEDDDGCSLVDTGYHTGLDALRAALPGPVHAIALTHVHSDHAGCAAALSAEHGAPVYASARAADLLRRWDRRGLWLASTGQELPRFLPREVPMDGIALSDRVFEVIETGGHATGGLSYFDPTDGLLITGDALWEDGFGILDPWVDGAHILEDARQALHNLSQVDGRILIPGHGEPFADLEGALQRAEQRLNYLARNPDRLLYQVLKNGLGFFKLMQPDADAATLWQAGMTLALAHDLDEAGASRWLAEAGLREP
jgi:glyoxylase-like metal-dependent hydrolase (beta-lactamase superfamily II)